MQRRAGHLLLPCACCCLVRAAAVAQTEDIRDEDRWQLIIALGCVSFFADGMYAALGFGPSICFQLGWQAVYLAGVGSGNLVDAGKYLAIQSMAMSFFQSFLQRKKADWRLAFWLGCPALVTTVLGVKLLMILDSIWLKRSLGIIFFLLAGKNALKHRQQQKR